MSPKKKKRISVSSKRQISIPKEYFEQLKIRDEVTLELYGNHMILKPINEGFDDFSEEILSDLIDEGYEGKQLLSELKKRKEQIGTAVDSLLMDTLKNGERTMLDELFGEEDVEI
ncbi:hypothetical protein J9303_10660 [Bacillaceae bacterium Marseille-Q3522]|nr:hypothetical protein [Bacillaceae bacterium Marseille-Q3522]